jgi:aryl-alcohol dehydrogenase-like predicted oxidoreductase
MIMEYTYLGRTGLQVSRLCLGTMNFGPFTTEEDSFAIMDTALENGVNFFDTANVYGRKTGEGITENIIGRWFAQGGGRREKVVLATKVYGTMGEFPNESRLSARHIKMACEASLKRLQTDFIDVYQMHHIDRNAPWEEVWQAMEQLVREGKVLYIGSSNFAGWHIAQANEIAASRNFLGLVSEQCLYNLASRYAEMDVIPACEDYGMGILPWSPLVGGRLAGKKIAGERRKETENVKWPTRYLMDAEDRVEQYLKYCDEIGMDPAHVALAWLLHQPSVIAPIIGPRTMEQLTSTFPIVDIELSDEILTKLDEIWPGPGPSPEAWAW